MYDLPKNKTTQGTLKNEINYCMQIVKLISSDFESVRWFCNVLLFFVKNSKKKVRIYELTIILLILQSWEFPV